MILTFVHILACSPALGPDKDGKRRDPGAWPVQLPRQQGLRSHEVLPTLRSSVGTGKHGLHSHQVLKMVSIWMYTVYESNYVWFSWLMLKLSLLWRGIIIFWGCCFKRTYFGVFAVPTCSTNDDFYVEIMSDAHSRVYRTHTHSMHLADKSALSFKIKWDVFLKKINVSVYSKISTIPCSI